MTIHLSRRAVLGSSLGAAALAFCPRTSLGHPSGENLSFLAIGDWGRKTSGQPKVAAAMATAARQLHPRFVVSTGDNIYREGVRSIDDPLWADVYERVYSDSQLLCPWYAVLGNHDHMGNPDAEVDYSRKSSRWNMPGRYYSRTETLAGGKLAEFFFLDTTELTKDEGSVVAFLRGHDTDNQMRWLDSKLGGSKALCKIVIGHHPVFSGGPHTVSSLLTRRLKPLFDRHGVLAYINGHDHNLQHIRVDGVHYLTSGSGSDTAQVASTADTLFRSETLGFLAGTVSESGMTVEFFDARSRSLYRTDLVGRT
jgi:tartrate-resistant acid phosphatase type 5